jgi:outer membrane protein TolC
MKSKPWLHYLTGLSTCLFILVVCPDKLLAQEVTINQCFTALEQNYPLQKNIALLNDVTRINNNSAAKGFLPQLQASAQATYQNEVTTIGDEGVKIPGIPIPDKDQYKATLSLQQNLYDGGNIAAQKVLNSANGAVSLQQNSVSLYQTKIQLNNLIFQILLSDESEKIAQSSLEDLVAQLKTMNAALKLGTAQATNVNALQAEELRAQQQVDGFVYDRQTLIDQINLLTGMRLGPDAKISVPPAESVLPDTVSRLRPEYDLYNKQRNAADAQVKLSKTALRPTLSLIGEENYGRPGYNFLRNDFGQFWLIGIKINWNLSSFYVKNNNDKISRLNIQQIAIQQDIFRLEQQQQLSEQKHHILKFKQQLMSDEQIIALRNKVRMASAAKLDNGTETATDYIVDLHAETEAKLARALHFTQLLQANEAINLIQGRN